MESMDEVLEDTNDQALHYLINDADWDHRDVMAEVARDASATLGDEGQTCLLIDETYFAKKGDHSAGVARQWNGRLGKTDNCQVGVFTALCCDNLSIPIDCDLYLPERWTEDPRRMRKAKIPTDHQAFKTKTVLAAEQIKRALANDIRFSWVAVDGGYGKCPQFIDEMAEMGLQFFADVHRTQRVFLDEPHPERIGRKKKLTVQADSVRLDKLLDNSENILWNYVTVRPGTKGPIVVRCKRFDAWIWNEADQRPHARKITVLISQMEDGTDTKFGITNSPAGLPTSSLAYRQRQRFWIEQAFKDGKSEVGLHQYQVRSWHGWHRHMALCMMALLYMMHLKLEARTDLPLLSAHDARNILAREFLQLHIGVVPNGGDDLLASIIATRHKKRLADIRNAYAKQGLEVPEHYSHQ